jgi:hypothetical protein
VNARRSGARRPEDDLPDVRDGLTRLERAVLVCLKRLQDERDEADRARDEASGLARHPDTPPRNVSTAMLYGRVIELVDCSVDELQATLQRLTGRGYGRPRR